MTNVQPARTVTGCISFVRVLLSERERCVCMMYLKKRVQPEAKISGHISRYRKDIVWRRQIVAMLCALDSERCYGDAVEVITPLIIPSDIKLHFEILAMDKGLEPSPLNLLSAGVCFNHSSGNLSRSKATRRAYDEAMHRIGHWTSPRKHNLLAQPAF